jgi:hypothetical protein
MIKKAAAIAALLAVILVIGIGIAKAHPSNDKPTQTAHHHVAPDPADGPENQPTWDEDKAPTAKMPASFSAFTQPHRVTGPTAAQKKAPDRQPRTVQFATCHTFDPDDAPTPAAPRG